MLKAKSRITARATTSAHSSVIAIALVAIAMGTTLATAATTLGAARATLETRPRGFDETGIIDCDCAAGAEEYNAARRGDRIPSMA